MSKKIYKDYFNIDPKYYAAVTADLIDSGQVSWKSFYPHETFIKLLEKTHAVLSGKDPRSLWVEGAYGTGKSHAALTVKSLLEASDEEVEAYFEEFGLSRDLCGKLIADKNMGKLLTIHRIGSGSIRSDQDLILAVQDSIMTALATHGIDNHGEASLRDAALKWLDKKANRDYFDQLIAEEEYMWMFGGQNVDAVIEQLRNGSPAQAAETMRNIITVAENNGITALRLDIQGMAEWIKNIISENNLSAILFVWDEFTEFFQNNPNSLTGFQTLAEISLSHPFYFMIVSHESRSLFVNADTAKKILDRFVQPVKIELPENMAFRLMAQAMKITSDPVLKTEWIGYKSELNTDLASVRSVIRESAKKGTSLGVKTVISDEELQSIIPIHPYAALLLKHISVAFNSNQRSMFDFIINNDDDLKAFKWFIANYGPLDQTNLLTIDMLWDFFCGKGQTGLNDDVRVILDSYNLLNSDKMSPDEQRVMKTVLLFNAISMRVSDVDLLKPTEQNIDLAFSGTGWSKGKGRSIAEKLVRDGYLFKKPVGNGRHEYTVANSTGDAATIRKKKEDILASTKTQDLLITADLISAIQLPASISGRFILEGAATKNFTQALTRLSSNHTPDRFRSLVTFAANDDEAAQIKSQILSSVLTNKSEIIYIDASLSPMGRDLFDQYIEAMAYSAYYAQNDKHRAGEFQRQAEKCLTEWQNKIASGAFMLYSSEHPSGLRMANLAALQEALLAIDFQRYPCGLEQYNIIANMFTKGPLAQGAESAILQKTAGTFKSANPNTRLEKALEGAWGIDNYWEDDTKKNLTIVRIKNEVEHLISEGFHSSSARVSVFHIFSELTKAPYGFMPNNISAFILGFVLKEYATGDYFWSNGSNSESMTPDKMKTMIANAINQVASPTGKFREEYIVAMSPEQKAFLTCTSKVFRIPATQCGSVENARDQIRIAMKKLSFPIWCVKYILSKVPHTVSDATLSEIIDNYCSIANTANGVKGSESELASDIGQAVVKEPAIIDDLANLLNDDNCRKGMLAYIEVFQGGLLKQLASQIGDNGAYLTEVKRKFNADAANWVWNSDTADDKIEDVILDYKIIVETNKSLQKCYSISDVVRGWNSRTNNIRLSYEAIRKAVGDLGPFLEELCRMKVSSDLPDQRKQRFLDLLISQREAFDAFYNDQISTFQIVASSFIGDMDDVDVASLYSSFPSGQFTKSSSEYFKYVEKEIAEFLKNQLKKRIRDLWHDKTGTKDPEDWSSRYDTPILCMFDGDERVEARQIFGIMRSSSPSEADANRVLRYLSTASFYDRLNDTDERDKCFMESVVGDYTTLLSDPQAVRDYLTSHTTEKPFYWIDNSTVRSKVKEMAEKQYKTDGCERAWSVIDEMSPEELREYLKELITENVNVGIEILKGNK